jgi:hypothetical protein
MPNQDRVAKEFEQRSSCVWAVFFDIDVTLQAIAAENPKQPPHMMPSAKTFGAWMDLPALRTMTT